MEPGPPARRLRDATGGEIDGEVGLRAVRGERLRQPGDHPHEEVRHGSALRPAGDRGRDGTNPQGSRLGEGQGPALPLRRAGVEKRFAVPVLLVYALILRPYVLDLVPNRMAHLRNVLDLCTSLDYSCSP